MNRRFTLPVYTAILTCSLGVGAYAQDSSSNSAPASQGKSAKDVTCAELSSMDTATVPGVLYFVAGYSEGERSARQSGMSSSNGGDASASTSEGSGDSSESSSTADSPTPSDAETSSATPDSAGADSSKTTSDSTASSGSTDTDVQIGRLTGYFNIPVQDVVIACESDPDRTISAILTEKNTGQSSDSTQSEADNTDTTEGSSQ